MSSTSKVVAERDFEMRLRHVVGISNARDALRDLMWKFIGTMQMFFYHTVQLEQTTYDEAGDTDEYKAHFTHVAGIPTSVATFVRMVITQSGNPVVHAAHNVSYEVKMYLHFYMTELPFNTLKEAQELIRKHCFFHSSSFLKKGGMRIFHENLSRHFQATLTIEKSTIMDNHGKQIDGREINLSDGRKILFWVKHDNFHVEIRHRGRVDVIPNFVDRVVSLETADKMIGTIAHVVLGPNP